MSTFTYVRVDIIFFCAELQFVPYIAKFFLFDNLLINCEMVAPGKISVAIVLILAIVVFVTQIGVGIYYVQKPVDCERSKFLTFLSLAGGFSGILAIIFLSFCCCSFRGSTSQPARPEPTEE